MSSATIEQEIQMFFCYKYNREITLDECFSISAEPNNNRKYCKKNECKSPERICLACASHDEVDMESIVMRPGSSLCEYHETHGFIVRRDQDPDEVNEKRKKEIRRVRERVESKHGHTKTHGEVLADIEAIDVADTESDKELVEDEQKLDVKYEDTILRIDPERIRRQAGQPREEFDERALRELQESIEVAGQIQPGLVIRIEGDPKHDYELDDGERRWIACRRAGIKYRAIIIEVANKSQQFAVSAIANFNRVGHSPIEMAHAIVRMKTELNWTVDKIAQSFGISKGYADQHLSLLRLHPDVQQMMSLSREKTQRLSVSIANSLTKFPMDKQIEHAKYIIDHQLRLDPARKYLRHEAEKSGVLVQKRQQHPSKIHVKFTTFIDVSTDKADHYIELGAKEVKRMFATRPPHHRMIAQQNIDKLMKKLEKIKEMLQ